MEFTLIFAKWEEPEQALRARPTSQMALLFLIHQMCPATFWNPWNPHNDFIFIVNSTTQPLAIANVPAAVFHQKSLNSQGFSDFWWIMVKIALFREKTLEYP